MQRWLQLLFLLLTASALAHAPERELVLQLNDLNQTLAASYRYDPYGNTTYSSGSLAAANVYRFSSKQVHVNSGLYSYGYRFYSPNWQRWLNQDPIGEWGGINLYGFVGNSPLSSVDPNGLLFKETFKKLGDWIWDQMIGDGEGQYDPDGNLAQRTAMLGNEGADTLQQMIEEGTGILGDQGTDALAGGAAGKLAGSLLGAVCKVGKKLWKPRLLDEAAESIGFADDAAKGGAELTGQIHHGISRTVHEALEAHPNLRGVYQARDPRFVTQAKDLPSHQGYQQWHRQLDAEVSRWIESNPKATPQQFENYLRQRYSQPDLSDRFPNGL